MDLNLSLIKNTWDQAANSLNGNWAINLYDEQKIDEKVSLEADGIIYSPVDDVNRPYPIFTLDFTLTWYDGVFEMKINFPNTGKPIKINNQPGLFIIREERVDNITKQTFYLNLNDAMIRKKDVKELLSLIYDFLFPKYMKRADEMMGRVNYWINNLPNIYAS